MLYIQRSYFNNLNDYRFINKGVIDEGEYTTTGFTIRSYNNRV